MEIKKLNSIDRLPPQNGEAESCVLGSIMLDKDAIIKVADILHSEDFYEERNKYAYLSMLELYEKSAPMIFSLFPTYSMNKNVLILLVDQAILQRS